MKSLRYQAPRTTRGKALTYLRRFRSKARSPSWWIRNSLLLGTWVTLGVPAYEKSIVYGVGYTIFAVLMAGGRAWQMSGARTMKQVSREYLERKVRLYSLLRQMQRMHYMTKSEVERFQQDVLLLIVSYVRGYRDDIEGTEIFANLLVEDGDELVVCARSHDHRRPGARYPKAPMIAWQAIQACGFAVLGDISEEPASASKHEKPYKSILAIAILDENRVLGAVSVDSARAHDFDNECDQLVKYLLPYVCLLGWTLIHNRVGSSEIRRAVIPRQEGAPS